MLRDTLGVMTEQVMVKPHVDPPCQHPWDIASEMLHLQCFAQTGPCPLCHPRGLLVEELLEMLQWWPRPALAGEVVPP